VKKIVLLIIIIAPLFALAQKPDKKSEKKAARKQRVDELRRRAAEGEIVFDRQTAFGIKLNTDGYGAFLELGRMKTIRKANLFSFELGERKHPKEEKITNLSNPIRGNPFIYGKINNFYYAKFGYSQQLMVGNKGNKNGVAVSAIYGGGFSAGLLKPYYIEINHPTTGITDIRYADTTELYFLSADIINGASGFGKGWGQIKFVPGVYAHTAVRFDYGRFNEVLSAMEIGLNAEFYTKTMPIMLLNKEKRFFFSAYFALTFGKRK
jgi:hypothetical protein